MGNQRNLRHNRERNFDIFVSPDMKIKLRSPDLRNNKSPILNNSNYYMENNNSNNNNTINSIYNDYSQISKNNISLQKTPLDIDNINKNIFYTDRRVNPNDNQNLIYYPNNIICNYSNINSYVEGSPISSFKYSASPQRSPGGKVELKINQFNGCSQNNDNYYRKNNIPRYKDKIHYIILLQRYFKERFKIMDKKANIIQSFWRGYWLRKIIYIRLIMFYKGQALIEHLMNFHSKLIKRNFKNLIYKCSFKPKNQIQYTFHTNKIELINRFKKLNLGNKKNHFDNESLKINNNSSFTFEGILNDLNNKSNIQINSIIQENERKFEKLYYDLLQKYEELKNQSNKFKEQLKNFEKNDFKEKNEFDDKKIFNQAFYLKESKINKYSFKKKSSEENENEDELLKEGEIIIPDDKFNKEIERITPKRNDKKLRCSKRMNEERKSKEDKEFIKKELEDRFTNQRRLRISNDLDENNNQNNLSLSTEIIHKKKISKFDLEDNFNKKIFENIQIDYSFKNINLIPIKNSEYKKNIKENDIIYENVIKNEDEFTIENKNKSVEEKNYYKEINQLSDSDEDLNNNKDKFLFNNEIIIQNNFCFSVIDKQYILEQLPIIEEEKEEELFSIQNNVNDIFIINSKNKNLILSSDNVNNLEIYGKKLDRKFKNLEIEQNESGMNILSENKLVKIIKYDPNIIEVQINQIKKEPKVKEFINLIHDEEKVIINVIGNKREETIIEKKETLNKLLFEIKSENYINIKGTKKENLNYTIEHFELINKGKIKKEQELQLINKENELIIPMQNKEINFSTDKIELKILTTSETEKLNLTNITLLTNKTLLNKKNKKVFSENNYTIDNEIFSIEGNKKEEKEIQTNPINIKIQKNHFQIENKKMEKNHSFILKKIKPTILANIKQIYLKKFEFPEKFEIQKDFILIEGIKNDEIKENSKENNLVLYKNLNIIPNTKISFVNEKDKTNDKLIDSIKKISEYTQTYNNQILIIKKEEFCYNPIKKEYSYNTFNIKQNEYIPSPQVVNFNILGTLREELEQSFSNEMIQTEENKEINNYNEEYIKENKYEIYNNNDFTFQIINEGKIMKLKENNLNIKNIESFSLENSVLREKEDEKNKINLITQEEINKVFEIYQNNDFTFEILKENKGEIKHLNINSIESFTLEKKESNKKLLEINGKIAIELLKQNKKLNTEICLNNDFRFEVLNEKKQDKLNINNIESLTISKIKKQENKIYEIYKNNNFTFEILNKEKIEIKKPESSYDIINISSFFIKKSSFLHESLNSKTRNSNIINNREISFKQESSSHNSQDSNKIIQIQFPEEKTILSSKIISFSVIDKDKNDKEKIIIEKPYNLKNEFDFSLIKPENILSNNFKIISSSNKKINESPFEEIKPLIYYNDKKEKENNNLSVSTLSINIEGKDLTISRDESKDITKDISKDITQISKDISQKNYDDDYNNEIKRNLIFKKLNQSKENEFNDFIPSFNNKDISYNEENEVDKTISKDKSIDTMNKSDNKQDNSYLGYQLDEPVKHPLQEENVNNTTFEMKDNYNNSPSFHHKYSLENEFLISKKFNKLILGDYIPNKNNQNQLFDDYPIERETFMPNYYMNFNKFNNYIITNYSFELIHDKKELLNKENDLSECTSLSQLHQFNDNIFTHHLIKNNKNDNSDYIRKGMELLKYVLPIQLIKVIKGNNKKMVFDNLILFIPSILKNKEMKKLVNNYSNKIEKIYLNKWKMKCLFMRMKEEIIQNIQKVNEKNIKYQRRTRFMIEGIKKLFEKNNEYHKKDNINVKNEKNELMEKTGKLIENEKDNKKDNKKNQFEQQNEQKFEQNTLNESPEKQDLNNQENTTEIIGIPKFEIDKENNKNEEKELYITTKEITIIKIPKITLYEKIILRNNLTKWKKHIKEKILIVNKNTLFIPSENKKIKNEKRIKKNKSFGVQFPENSSLNLSIDKHEISLIKNKSINKTSFDSLSMSIDHNQIQIDSIANQERNIQISFLPPISERIIDESSNEEKEMSSNISNIYNKKVIKSQNEIVKKTTIEMKDKEIQSSPLFDVNVNNNNKKKYENIIQTLPSLDEVFISKDNFNSYNIRNINNNEILKREQTIEKNNTFNAKKKNSLNTSPHVQISVLPNSAKFSNIIENKEESFKSNQKNNFTDEYEMNIPSNEQNDDFIIDSINSLSFKNKNNSHSLSESFNNTTELKRERSQNIQIKKLRIHSYSTSRDFNLENSVNNSKTIEIKELENQWFNFMNNRLKSIKQNILRNKFDIWKNMNDKLIENENIFENENNINNSEKIQIIDTIEDFDSLNNEDLKNDNLINNNLNSRIKDNEPYVTIYINKKKNSEKKEKISKSDECYQNSIFHKFISKLKKQNKNIEMKNILMKILNRSELKANQLNINNNNLLKEYFKIWKNQLNALIESLISIKSLNIQKKNNISSPNCLSLLSKEKRKSILKNSNRKSLKDENTYKENKIKKNNVKELVPRIRINEKLRLLVSIKQKARTIFNKWKKTSFGENFENLRVKNPKIKSFTFISHKSKLSNIISAKQLQKRCRSDNFEILFKEKVNFLNSNFKKGYAQKYLNKIFKEFIQIQIPKICHSFQLYKNIPKAVNLIKLHCINNSFNDFVKNSFSDNEKYIKIYKKVENEIKEKSILPDLKNSAALFIQVFYKKHLNKIRKEFRIKMLKKLFSNLDEDNIILLLYYIKWKYRINKKKKNEKEINQNFKKIINKLALKNIVNTFIKLTQEYADYIHIITFNNIIKNIFFRKLFNSMRLKFILYKFISDDDAEFKKKYIRSSIIKKWNEKCKLIRRRKNIIMKIKKLITLHCKRILMNILKFKKFKLHLISFALIKRNNSSNK